MQILQNLLKEGGFVYIECPDADKYNDVIHAPFQEINTEHINHFNKIDFENLFGLYNFNKLNISEKFFKLPSGKNYHAIFGLFQKVKEKKDFKLINNTNRSKNINKYLETSEILFNQMLEVINKNYNIKLALVGVGQLTYKLLFFYLEQNKNNFFLFDSNPINIGKKINGIEILNTNDILNYYTK